MSRVVALCGGVGGAKLAAGLADVLPQDELLIAVNTGDDFEHLGLNICPDIDSTLYALAGLNDTERGWGRRNESWNFMSALGDLGGPTWFRLGDRDLATHVLRSARLAQGASASQVTDELARALGIGCRVVPMSDDPVRTFVQTDDGALAFQDYFVARACAPAVRGLEYRGANTASVQPELLAALRDEGLRAVVICPSNPWLSIGPMLALPALRAALAACPAPVLAVSPFVRGRALKGPADKIARELGLPATAAGIARVYHDILDALLIDPADASECEPVRTLGFDAVVVPTVMTDRRTRQLLAREVLAVADRWAGACR